MSIQFLGKGGFGAVCLVSGKAIKRFPLDKRKHAEREINIHLTLTILGINYIPRYLGRAENAKEIHLWMDYKGVSLWDRYLKGSAKLDTVDKIQNLFFQCIRAILELHNHGFAHQDIKPANLLISEGVVYAADFGLTSDKIGYYGTKRFLAPETIYRDTLRKRLKPSQKADVFSLGLTFVSLLKGKYPLASEHTQNPKTHLFALGALTAEMVPWEISLQNHMTNPRILKILGTAEVPKIQLFSLMLSKTALPLDFQIDLEKLIAGMLCLNPKNRLTLEKAIQHPALQTHYTQKIMSLCQNRIAA